MLQDNAKELFSQAGLELTQMEHDILIAQEITQQYSAWTQATSTLYAAKILDKALANHAVALNKSADASTKLNQGLVNATWALVLATIALGAVGVLQIVAILVHQ